MGPGESLGQCRVGGQVRGTLLKIVVPTEQTVGGEQGEPHSGRRLAYSGVSSGNG